MNDRPFNRDRSAMMGLIKGAIAGAAAVWVMDRVTWAMYKSEDPISESTEAHRQEKEAQVERKYAAQAAVAKASRLAGTELSEKQNYQTGQVVHYLMGVVPGSVYGALADQVPYLRAGRGLLYGLGLFIVWDEGVGPTLGIASRPTKYPQEAHWRGLAGHLVLGAITETVLGTLDELMGAASPPEASHRQRMARPERQVTPASPRRSAEPQATA